MGGKAKRPVLGRLEEKLEAGVGIEPAYDGFAVRCMATLPPRRRGIAQNRMPFKTKRGSALAPPGKLERAKSLELSTSTLARLRSTN